MADNVAITPGAGATIAGDDIGGVIHQRVKIEHGADGSATDVSAASPLPVTAASLPLPSGAASAANQSTEITALATLATALANLLTELQAKADLTETQPVSLAVAPTTAVTGPLTDTQLRATAVPVSGTVTATTGGLTDTQLRATAVPVSGTVTASGPLTDTQLRATAVPVSGTVTTNPSIQALTTVTGTRSTSGDGTAVISAPSSGNHVVIVNLEVNPKEATTTIILKSGSTAKRTWTLAQNSLYANDYPRGNALRMGSAAAVYLNLDADSDTNYAIDYFVEAD